MAQVFFSANAIPQETDLDGNFTELFDLREQITTNSYAGAAPKIFIDGSGNFNLGGSFNLNTTGGVFLAPGGNAANFNIAAGDGFGFWSFYRSGVKIGGISQTGTTGVSFITSSDYRLKSNIQTLVSSGAFIDSLRPVTWSWLSDGTPGAGFIAHELQAVSPSSVTGTKDAVQAIGTVTSNGSSVAVGVPQPARLDAGQAWTQTGTAPVYQAVEYGSPEVIAMLVAEVQSLRRRVAAIEPVQH